MLSSRLSQKEEANKPQKQEEEKKLSQEISSKGGPQNGIKTSQTNNIEEIKQNKSQKPNESQPQKASEISQQKEIQNQETQNKGGFFDFLNCTGKKQEKSSAQDQPQQIPKSASQDKEVLPSKSPNALKQDQQKPLEKNSSLSEFFGFGGSKKEETQLSRPQSAVTQASDKKSTGSEFKGDEITIEEIPSIHKSFLLDDGTDATKAMEDIAAVIFNSRKVEFMNELGSAVPDVTVTANKSFMLFEINNKDNNGRSILHRGAFDQHQNQVSDVLSALDEMDPIAKSRENNHPDKYGNTPLMLSCIRRYEEKIKQEQQYEVVKMLLQRGYADSNTQNPQTHFTPLHWACIHGANDIVKILLKHQAKPYIPDKRGYFPIDYAGIFKHDKTVALIITHHLQESVSLVKQSLRQAVQIVPPTINQNGKMFRDNVQVTEVLKAYWNDFFKSQQGVSSLMQFSPIYHTNMLYWACMFDTIPLESVQQILRELEAYPEGPVSIENWRTPCHAAAQVGSSQKLKELLSEVNKRYKAIQNYQTIVADKEDPYLKYKKPNLCLDFENRWDQIRRLKQYRKLNLFHQEVFQLKLQNYRERAHAHAKRESGLHVETNFEKFDFEFLDKNLNTPIHVASQNGKSECIEIMLVDYKMSIDRRNIEGWMAKDIVQYDSVRKTFRTHYKRIERMIKRSSFLISQNSGPLPQANSGQITNKQATTQSSRSGQITPINDQEANISSANSNQLDEISNLTERERLNREFMTCRDFMPEIPPIVLKVSLPQNEESKNTGIVNNMIDLLVQSKFQIKMIPTLEDDIYYIALKLVQEDLEAEAKLMELKVKLINIEAKRTFEPSQKHLYEPFRTKDIQAIIQSKISRLVNIQQLIKQKIVLQVILMHDLFSIHDIKIRWWRFSHAENGKYPRYSCCFPQFLIVQPLPMISYMMKENIDYQYNEISTVKNYFGEKIGFFYAFMSYYTVWLLIPAIGGLALTLYQLVINNVDTIFTSLYALLVCIWVTIFIERWKRKSAEISQKWGVSENLLTNNSERRIMREDFQGYEYFSHASHNTEKKTYKASNKIIFFILQVLIYTLLIGCCIAAFFGHMYLKQIKVQNETLSSFMSTISGIINGIIIAIIDAIYSFVAAFFIEYENHKYQDSYEKSYVYKIFIFKFVNTNLSLFYTAFNDRNFHTLYYLLLGMALQKTVQIFILKNCKKIITYWIQKRFYFRKVHQMAQKQVQQHQSFIQDIEGRNLFNMNNQNSNEASIELRRQESLKSLAIFKDLDFQNFPSFQRLAFNVDGYSAEQGPPFSEQSIFIDYIELNQKMLPLDELTEIYETSEVFILFGLATLYSCACPIIPVIVIAHNIVDMNFSLYIRYSVHNRNRAHIATNIDPWLSIVEFMALAAVISNCLLIYFSTPTFSSWIQNNMGQSYKEVFILWILVGIEHFIIFVKEISALSIKDVPNWVEKSQLRVVREERKLAIQAQEQDKLTVFSVLNEKLNDQNTKRKKQMEEMNQIVGQLEKKLVEKESKIVKLENELKSSSDQKGQLDKQIKKLKLNQAEKPKDPSQMSLVEFLGISPSEWFAKGRALEIDKALVRNFSKRLIYQTFVSLEKQILAKRIGRLFDTKLVSNQANLQLTGGLQINCAQCVEKLAILECMDCMDHFCKSCSDELHSKSEICNNHVLINLINLQQFDQTQQRPQKWKKFEYYNFPVFFDNDHYQSLQTYFLNLKSQYLEMNYIESQDKINLQSLFVDRQYDLLTDIQGKAMMTRDKRIFTQDENQQQIRTKYNDEELYYMNKVAFCLFANKSHNTTFQQFNKSLSVLQSGPFLQRCTFWLQLLNEEQRNIPGKSITQPQGAGQGSAPTVSDTDECITRGQLEEAFKFSFVQRKPSIPLTEGSPTNYKDIVDLIFKSASIKVEKSLTKEDHLITIGQVIETITKNEEIRDFMQCVLQFRPAAPPSSIQQTAVNP